MPNSLSNLNFLATISKTRNQCSVELVDAVIYVFSISPPYYLLCKNITSIRSWLNKSRDSSVPRVLCYRMIVSLLMCLKQAFLLRPRKKLKAKKLKNSETQGKNSNSSNKVLFLALFVEKVLQIGKKLRFLSLTYHKTCYFFKPKTKEKTQAKKTHFPACSKSIDLQ